MSPVLRQARGAFPRPGQVRQLPVQLARTIPAEWEDRNGHVGVQYFQALFAEGAWRVLEPIGVDADWFRRHRRSQFDLEHHLHYRAELHAGDAVSCYNRVVARSERRFHGIFLVVNDSSDRLAATLEYVTAGIDMQSRRMAAFPDELARGLDRLIDEHARLDWAPPLCGVLAP